MKAFRGGRNGWSRLLNCEWGDRLWGRMGNEKKEGLLTLLLETDDLLMQHGMIAVELGCCVEAFQRQQILFWFRVSIPG